MRTAAPCSITARRRSSALSTRPAANSTASSVNPSAEPSSYPQIPRTRLFLKICVSKCLLVNNLNVPCNRDRQAWHSAICHERAGNPRWQTPPLPQSTPALSLQVTHRFPGRGFFLKICVSKCLLVNNLSVPCNRDRKAWHSAICHERDCKAR